MILVCLFCAYSVSLVILPLVFSTSPTLMEKTSPILESVIPDSSSMPLWFVANTFTTVIALYTAYSSIKLLLPYHPLYPRFSEGFVHLADAWGVPGNGRNFRVFVGLSKLASGLGAAVCAWLSGFSILAALCLSFSITGIVAIYAGAVMTNFGKGWEATKLPAALFAGSVVNVFLQASFGGLAENPCILIIASFAVLGMWIYMFIKRLNREDPGKVAVITQGEQPARDSYYRLA